VNDAPPRDPRDALIREQAGRLEEQERLLAAGQDQLITPYDLDARYGVKRGHG